MLCGGPNHLEEEAAAKSAVGMSSLTSGFPFDQAMGVLVYFQVLPTREALLSEAKVFRTQIGSVGGSCFVDDEVSCYQLKVALLFRFVWWLGCLLKEGASAFCSLR